MTNQTKQNTNKQNANEFCTPKNSLEREKRLESYRTWPFRITFVVNRTDTIAGRAQICSRAR